MSKDVCLGDMIPGEQVKARREIGRLPKAVRKFYSDQYSVGSPYNNRPPGTFLGLCCKVCNRWREYGHEEDCPVLDLEPANTQYLEYVPERLTERALS